MNGGFEMCMHEARKCFVHLEILKYVVFLLLVFLSQIAALTIMLFPSFYDANLLKWNVLCLCQLFWKDFIGQMFSQKALHHLFFVRNSQWCGQWDVRGLDGERVSILLHGTSVSVLISSGIPTHVPSTTEVVTGSYSCRGWTTWVSLFFIKVDAPIGGAHRLLCSSRNFVKQHNPRECTAMGG